jgi:hypothetical protein
MKQLEASHSIGSESFDIDVLAANHAVEASRRCERRSCRSDGGSVSRSLRQQQCEGLGEQEKLAVSESEAVAGRS